MIKWAPLDSLHPFLLFLRFTFNHGSYNDGWLQPLAGFVRPDGDPDTDLETDGLATSSSSGKHNAVTSSHFGFLLVSQSARKQPDSPLKRVGFISFCSLHGAAGRRGGAVRGEGREVGEGTRTGQKSGRPFHPRYCVSFQSSIGWVVRSCHFLYACMLFDRMPQPAAPNGGYCSFAQ